MMTHSSLIVCKVAIYAKQSVLVQARALFC
nr:MAG TPA: hypothetical protein [Caudoviricetes sp.]